MEAPIDTRRPQDQSTSMKKSSRSLWFTLARGGWIGTAGTCVLLLVVALPVRYGQLANPPTQVRAGLLALGLPLEMYAFSNLIFDSCVVLGFFIAATLLFWHKSDEWFPLLVAFLLITFGTGGPIIVTLQEVNPAWWPLTGLIDVVSWGLLGFFLSLFPDGRFVPRWSLWYNIAMIVYSLLWDLPILPAAWHPSNWPLLLFILFQLGPMLLYLGFQIYRYRYVSGPVQRQQAKWLLFGVAVVLCTIPLGLLSITPSRTPATILGLFVAPALHLLWLCIPFSLAIAILRYRLWDIDVIINRTLVYGLLTAGSVGIYMLVVISFGALFQAQGNIVISLLATGLIAVLFQPLRIWLQHTINRLMFGERDDPYAVLSHLGQRLEATLAPDEVLPAIVETVAHSLKLPYVALSLKQDETFNTITSYGVSRDKLLHMPLIYQTETIGELLLAPRAPEEAFTANERQLLKELARQAGIAVHGILLTADLERSRQHIVATREMARRQLGSDLHDGLGHILASLLRKTETASNLLERDPVTSGKLLSELKQQTRVAIDEARRLAHTLHPPELELLGLVEALREQMQQYHQPYDDTLHITLQATAPLPPLPIAVESAAYYIALEAVNNVYRHAKAQHCHLRLEHLQESASSVVGMMNATILELEITDDGCGFLGEEEKKQRGLGLTSMRERATELGGTCLIKSSLQGGTRILARLPCWQVTADHM